MKKSSNLSRRQFLAVAAGLVGVGSLAGYAGWSLYREAARRRLAGAGAALLTSGTAEQIGAAYLKTRRPAVSEHQLVTELFGGWTGAHRNVAEDAVRRFLQESIHGDCAQGRTWLYDGWILSETEGRLCGLAHRYAGAGGRR
jgi:hypothetical protein